MAKFTHKAVGFYSPNNGAGLTVQDAIEMLRKIPLSARKASYLTITTEDGYTLDVTGMQVGQSSQAPANEVSVGLKLDGKVKKIQEPAR